jgi:hypothetical protein
LALVPKAPGAPGSSLNVLRFYHPSDAAGSSNAGLLQRYVFIDGNVAAYRIAQDQAAANYQNLIVRLSGDAKKILACP